MRKLALPLLSAIALATATSAHADNLISYLSEGASFSNGATMNMQWTFDSTTQQVTAINGGLQDGNGYFAFVTPNSTKVSGGNGPNAYEFYTTSNGVKLYFDFNAATGALLMLNGNNNYTSYVSWAGVSNALTNVGGYKITSGFLPAVPEPGTVALMLSGLGVVGMVARRRRAADSSVCSSAFAAA